MILIALAVFASGSPVRAELVVFYDFNDASNPGVALDKSGNDIHGDVIDAEYTPDGGGWTGQAGDRAMDFGEFNNFAYVDIVGAADGVFQGLSDNDQATVAMWIFGGDEQPVDQWTFYAGPGRQLGSHIPWGNGIVYFDVAGCCGANTRINGQASPEMYSGEWNHWAFIKDEGYTAIYHNGELFLDSGLDIKDPLLDITEFFIGVGPVGDERSYAGLMDDVGIWSTALSEEDIVKLYQGTYFGGGGGVPGDFDGNGVLDAADIDTLSAAVRAGSADTKFDLNGDGMVSAADRSTWVNDLRKTYFGDSNLDGEFGSSDFVFVFTAGQYEDATNGNSTWATGDWDGNGDFTSSDFVTAFQAGGYEQGPRGAVASVPEPGSMLLLLVGVLAVVARWRRR
jgi:hypothetical protein